MKRFHNEARAACKLEHPNTVRVMDFGQTREGLLFIAMEYLHGRSLRTEIERAGRMPAARALQIVAQISASLSEAHSQGIIHRDIKPDNVFLVDLKGATDMVKVLDFSVAKLDAPDAQLTRAGVVFGTPAYMSPEQGRGIPLGPTSDIYAVGIVLYEMLMGRPPFEAAIPTEVVMMHLRNPPPPLQGVPTRVAQLVMSTLDKDPARRPQHAGDLEQACQQLIVELSGMLPAMPGGRTATPPAQLAVHVPDAPRPSLAHPRTQALPEALSSLPLGRQANLPSGGHPGGTMVLTESGALPPGTTGLPQSTPSAWAPEPSHRGHGHDETDARGTPTGQRAPAGALFWIAWMLLGLGGGLAAHFIMHHG